MHQLAVQKAIHHHHAGARNEGSACVCGPKEECKAAGTGGVDSMIAVVTV